MQKKLCQRVGFFEPLQDRRVLSAVSLVADVNALPITIAASSNTRAYAGEDRYVAYRKLNDIQPHQDQLLTPFELWKFSSGEEPVLLDTIQPPLPSLPAEPASHPPSSTVSLVASDTDLYILVRTHSGELSTESGEIVSGSEATLWRHSIEDGTSIPLFDLPANLELTRFKNSPLAVADNWLLLGNDELWGIALDEEPDAGDLELIATERAFSSIAIGDNVFMELGPPWARSLWISDGTADGTIEVIPSTEKPDVLGTYQDQLVVTTESDDGTTVAATVSEIGQLTNIIADGQVVYADGNQLYTVRGEHELWVTDGQGESNLVWQSELPFDNGPPHPTLSEHNFNFHADGVGTERVRTNGSVAVPVDASFAFGEPGIAEGQDEVEELIFLHDDGDGLAWWTSDGTSAGTTEYFTGPEASGSSHPLLLGVVDDQLLFSANTSNLNSFDLFGTDGTQSESLTTGLVRHVHESGFFGNGELWFTDGTPEGTDLVADLSTGPGTPDSHPSLFTEVGDSVLFVANDSELWSVDAEGLNPLLVTDAFSEIASMFVDGDRVFISGSQAETPNGLWVLPQTGSEDLQLIDTFSSAPRRLGVVGDKVIFTVTNGSTLEVWAWEDGTTELLMSSDSLRSFHSEVIVNGLYVLPLSNAPTLERGVSIWATDGTAAGSQVIEEFESENSRFTQYANENGTHLAIQDGSRIWVSDGTPDGTQMLDSEGQLAGVGPSDFYLLQQVPVASQTENVTVDTTSILRLNPESLEQEVLLEPGTFEIENLGEGSINPALDAAVVEFNGNIYFAGSDLRYGEEVRRLDLDPIPGDANGDNVVNFQDFLVLSASFGKESDAVFAEGDFDGNDKVNFVDFLLLAQNFGATE